MIMYANFNIYFQITKKNVPSDYIRLSLKICIIILFYSS